MLEYLVLVLIFVAVVIAWRLIAGKEPFNKAWQKIGCTVKRLTKPVLIFVGIFILIAGITTLIVEYVDYQKREKESAFRESENQRVHDSYTSLNAEQQEKFQVCMKYVEADRQWYSDGHFINFSEIEDRDFCIVQALNKVLLRQQSWWADCGLKDLLATGEYGKQNCSEVLLESAKTNNWPINFFNCYHNNEQGKVSGLVWGCPSSRKKKPQGEIALFAPLDWHQYVLLYNQPWAVDYIECFVKHEKKIYPRPNCDPSFDVIMRSAIKAGWPMGKKNNYFPVSYYKLTEVN